MYKFICSPSVNLFKCHFYKPSYKCVYKSYKIRLNISAVCGLFCFFFFFLSFKALERVAVGQGVSKSVCSNPADERDSFSPSARHAWPADELKTWWTLVNITSSCHLLIFKFIHFLYIYLKKDRSFQEK